MKISIITTVNHNVGDDFVREGIKYLLRKYYSNLEIKFENIHKHSPITVRYGFEWFRNNSLSRIFDLILPLSISKDRVIEADIVVQSGAPVYWCHTNGPHCYKNEWYVPLIERRFNKNIDAKLINLAAGTCQTYHSDGSEFCNFCKEYAKKFYKLCTVTTVRDKLSKIFLNHIDVIVPVIPCPSIFAIDAYNLKNEGSEYIVLNYMKGGAHYSFGQDINFKKWQNEFQNFYFELKKQENVVFSCHNAKEVNEALSIDPSAKIFFKNNDFLAYMWFYSKAKFGITNRVHAAFLLASFGKAVVVIGNDSRAKMVKEIGLESFFVNDVSADFLMNQCEYLKTGANNFIDRFAAIKEKAYNDYLEELSIL